MSTEESTETKKSQGETSSKSDESLLKQIREDFTYHKQYWSENYEEAAKDMDCVAGIPPTDFKDDRAGRPCIWPDEISQYVKQANNNLRQNKRSIKISPRSDDADPKDAEHRQAYIRGIEYASKAQAIYSSGFEAAVSCAIGSWRVKLQVVSGKGHQEPRLARIPNQFTVYPDPDAQEPDFSDQSRCFVLDSMRESTFARRYPKAKKRSFTGSDRERAPGWFSADNITVAEYWVRDEVDNDGEKLYNVTQYITNGLEILEKNEWIGSWIPIVMVLGEELYVRTSGQSKRMFMSLVRRARAAQQMLAYVASQEAEEFGMAPRAPFLVLKGTVDPTIWATAHKTPRAYLEYDGPTGWNWTQGAPPVPIRVPFIPNAQAYEIAYERWRRAIQAAMGISPLPTSAQRQNEKSGVALEKIQNQEAIGAFHFTDNFARALGNTGRQINELITKLAELDSLPSQLLGKDQKDEDVALKVAPSTQKRSESAASEELPEEHLFFAHEGQFEIAVDDGPNYLSQREEASNFADTLLQFLPKLGVAPPIMQQVLSIAIKLKNIGTYGDEIAELLSPPDPNNMPPQAKAIMAQAQGQIQQLTQELQKLQMEKLGKVTETHGKLALADHEAAIRMVEADKDRETKVLIAEISTKAQNLEERMSAWEDMMKQFHDQAHDAAMQKQQQAHEQELAQQQAAQAQDQQNTQISADQQSQTQAEQAQQAQAEASSAPASE